MIQKDRFNKALAALTGIQVGDKIRVVNPDLSGMNNSKYFLGKIGTVIDCSRYDNGKIRYHVLVHDFNHPCHVNPRYFKSYEIELYEKQ